MVSFANMTEAGLARADTIIENAFEPMTDIIANPSAAEHVPGPSTVEVIARTERFAVEVVATP